MSLVDPSAGRAFIWVVSSFLFFSIITGGGCLLMYMILPETETTTWLPIAGLSLVCLPWFFWFLTFFYRVVSRACGFRVSFGIGATNGGGRGAGNTGGFGGGAAGNAVENASAESPGGDAKEEENDSRGGDQKRNSSFSSSSARSRESEMPFAISMGS